MSHERFMGRALELAERGLEEGELPIGSLLAVDDRIVAEDYWRGRQELGWLRHPELVVLLKGDEMLSRERREASLYTTLEPCLMCMGAAMSFLVRTVIYGLNAPRDGAGTVAAQWAPPAGHPVAGTPAFYRVPDVVAGVRRDEGASLVRRYLTTAASRPTADYARSLVEP